MATAVITNAGLTLLASALINSAPATQVTYVAIGTGTGTLSSGLTSGVAVTSLAVNALASGVASGQSLTLIYQTYTATVTTTASVLAGATTIPIASFTPSFSFPAGSGLVNTPAATDTQLQAEASRVEIAAGVAGANAGETLISGYFDPSVASGTYLEVGYFGGANATLTANSGTLVARDIMWWSHTVNVDSFTNQLDSTV